MALPVRSVGRLEPWREQVVLDALGTLGSVARPLGLLAGALGRPEEADAHFVHALEVHEQLGATSLAARTTLDWGLSLLRGGRRDDHLRSRELLAQAAEAASRLGLPELERRAEETTLAASGSGRAR